MSEHADPGRRAADRLAVARRRDTRARTASALGLAMFAVTAPLCAAPLTGDPGATVGAVLAGLLLGALAAVLWPWRWSEAEEEHHRLAAVWRELRTDAEHAVPWERYAAWAEPAGDAVRLELVLCAAAQARTGGAPSPYRRKIRGQLDAEDLAAAAEVMEILRAQATEFELEAQQGHELAHAEADQRRHEETLAAIDRATDEEILVREDDARRELEAQDAAERRVQAEALARALRRP